MRGVATVLAFMSLTTSAACAPRDKAIWGPKNDPAMEAAMDQAQATLPQFWARVDGHPTELRDPAVKVGYPTAHGGYEFLWVYVEDHQPSEIHGEIANEPEDVPGVHAGQQAAFPARKIVDWTYLKGDVYYGQYTTRVMLQRADAKTRAEEGARLSSAPLETEAD
jgi:uncharacterized protein YegJ (DUF2314 family)